MLQFRKCRLNTWEGRLPELGEYLQTRRGSTYQVVGVYRNMRPDPKSVTKLDLLKLSPEEIAELPEDTVFHFIRWGQSKT